VAVEKNQQDMVALMLDMVSQPLLLSFLREPVRDFIVVAARHNPELQILLLDRLPDVHLRQSWVYDLVKNDTTGIMVKFLLRQGINFSEPDEHGWSMMDFAYATDEVLFYNKTDQEISRVAKQDYRFPDSWVSVATDEQRAMEAAKRRPHGGASRDGSNSKLPVKFKARMGVPYIPYRADHPIPPHRASYFEVKIVNEGQNGK
jgi:hypothetical protein